MRPTPQSAAPAPHHRDGHRPGRLKHVDALFGLVQQEFEAVPIIVALDLLENELFGHESGAFTGASSPLLARHFLAKYSVELARPAKVLSQAALEKLSWYDWPGNVRELENAIA